VTTFHPGENGFE